MSVLRCSAHKGLKNGEEDAAVLRNLAFFADFIRCNAYHRIFRKCGKGVVSLVSQNVSVGQKQDARPAGWFVFFFPVGQVPAGMKELPGDLKGDKRFARAGCQCQQDARLMSGNGCQYAFNGYFLVVS